MLPQDAVPLGGDVQREEGPTSGRLPFQKRRHDLRERLLHVPDPELARNGGDEALAIDDKQGRDTLYFVPFPCFLVIEQHPEIEAMLLEETGNLRSGSD